jgi:hypothetical protein
MWKSGAHFRGRSLHVSNVGCPNGTIEAIALPAKSVHVMISNCVINRSTDERRFYAYPSRVFKPGGPFRDLRRVVRGACLDVDALAPHVKDRVRERRRARAQANGGALCAGRIFLRLRDFFARRSGQS